jgi:hypothetical protein
MVSQHCPQAFENENGVILMTYKVKAEPVKPVLRGLKGLRDQVSVEIPNKYRMGKMHTLKTLESKP